MKRMTYVTKTKNENENLRLRKRRLPPNSQFSIFNSWRSLITNTRWRNWCGCFDPVRGQTLVASHLAGKWRTRQKSPCRRYGITHESMRCDETDVRYLTASWKQIPHNIPAIEMAGYQYQISNGNYSANGSLIIIFRISRYVVDIIKRKLSQIIDLCVGA